MGHLLACLAAAVPPGGRVLEIGTGMGVGLAWIVTGLEGRNDVEVISVECDPLRSEDTRGEQWPPWVQLLTADIESLLPDLGSFALVFADAEGGKWTGLDLTINSLDTCGVLVVDDMDASQYDDEEQRRAVANVRTLLQSDDRLVVAEIEASSGIIIGTRKSIGT